MNSEARITKVSGFTLIELLIVISILAVLGSAGVASFVSYSRSQTLNTAALDIVTTLQVARSRAATQIKKSDCNGKILDGYRFNICKLSGSDCNPSSLDYELVAVCGGGNSTTVITTKSLPSQVSWNTNNSFTPPLMVTFPIIKGGAIGSGTIKLIHFGLCRNVNIDNSGNISVATPVTCP